MKPRKHKPVIFTKQFHFGLSASFSRSRDIYVYFEIRKKKLDFEIKYGVICSDNKTLDGETIEDFYEDIFALSVCLTSDKTYYKVKATQDQLEDELEDEELARSYLRPYLEKGWRRERGIFWDRLSKYKDKIIRARREVGGYVIPEWNEDLNPMDYKGGFSDVLFSTFASSYLQTYLGGKGGVYGYIGHLNRTFALDRELEWFLRDKGWTNHMIQVFLCCIPGRHFADQLNNIEDIEKHFNSYDPSRESWFKEEVMKG